MNDVRRAMVWLLVLAAIVIAGDHLAALVLRQVLLRSQFRFSRLYRGGNNAEIVILGDSRGVHAFHAPSIEAATGLRALNLSYNSMSPPIAEAVMLDYLDHNRAPRLVIIEATSVVTTGALVTELRTYAGMSPRMRALYAKDHRAAAEAGRLFWLFPLNSELFLQALHYMRHGDQDWIFRERMPAALRVAKGRGPLNPKPGNVEALARLIHTLRARGIDVRLVIAPYSPNTQPVNAAGFKTWIEQRTGEPALDYINALDDFDDFADRVHPNESGSRKLLGMLIRDGALGMARPATRF